MCIHPKFELSVIGITTICSFDLIACFVRPSKYIILSSVQYSILSDSFSQSIYIL